MGEDMIEYRFSSDLWDLSPNFCTMDPLRWMTRLEFANIEVSLRTVRGSESWVDDLSSIAVRVPTLPLVQTWWSCNKALFHIILNGRHNVYAPLFYSWNSELSLIWVQDCSFFCNSQYWRNAFNRRSSYRAACTSQLFWCYLWFAVIKLYSLLHLSQLINE